MKKNENGEKGNGRRWDLGKIEGAKKNECGRRKLVAMRETAEEEYEEEEEEGRKEVRRPMDFSLSFLFFLFSLLLPSSSLSPPFFSLSLSRPSY